MNARNVDEVLCLLRSERRHRTLVTTNGVFDLLHVGHLDCIGYAARFGEILVVGINSDDWVRRNKGPRRPIIPQLDRQRMVGALTLVTHTFIFGEQTPSEFLEKLRPEVHVKGPGWGGAEALPETQVVRKYGGCVLIVPQTLGVSTTAIVEEIRRSYC